MGVIKGVLKEELERSQLMLERYREEIAKAKGCLVKKRIGRRYYWAGRFESVPVSPERRCTMHRGFFALN